MKIYLDDDSVAGRLIPALRQAGHDVRTPAEAGLAGAMTRFTYGKRSDPSSCSLSTIVG